MKRIIFLLAVVFFSVAGKAQDRWMVQLNNKTLLLANEEDTLKNRVWIDDLKKGALMVTYHPGKVENERKRRIMIFDGADRELYSKEAHSISVSAKELKKWKWESPQIHIYTIPVLGEDGANVRLRRVHLATVYLDKKT
ncbi:MAG TPA: hypothetical protein VMR70_10395 [Flavisolibacter sp.]|nr:hypothetical protein [Flavisolibacter sp.]